MSRLRCILLQLVLVVASLLPASAENYERVERRNLWNLGRNVTGILRDSITISYAELYSNFESGDYRNFSDASQMWGAGAVAKTISHHESLSMIGSFSYDHTQGEDMCGSMFISPNLYPFDLLEFTPGDKSLQSYNFMGGISSEVNSRLSVGLQGQFGAQNYAKYKDLRHYNYRMELSIVPSISYKLGDATVGASYIYSRNSETVRAQEVGSTAAAYYVLLDKGLMSGAYETWGGTGVHLDESGIDGFPVRENFHGVALQAQWRGIYGEVEYLSGGGEVGEKLTYWFDFPSQSYTARLGYSKLLGERLHLFMVEAQLYRVENYENVIGSNTENGVTTDVIYGSNNIFASEQISINPRYEMMALSGGNFEVAFGYYQNFARSTQMYPYVDELTTRCYQASVGGMLPICGTFELGGKLLFSTGESSDDSYQVTSDIVVGDKPTFLEEYYNIKNEYLTATTLSSSLSLRYNHPRSYYAELGAKYIQPFNLSYIDGDNRWGCTVKIGYKF